MSDMDPFDAKIMGAVDATVAAARDEIATLRARVAELESPGYDFGACVLQVREIDRLRAEIATLRAALTRIADLCQDGVVTLGQVEHIARKALASPPPHDGEGGK